MLTRQSGERQTLWVAVHENVHLILRRQYLPAEFQLQWCWNTAALIRPIGITEVTELSKYHGFIGSTEKHGPHLSCLWRQSSNTQLSLPEHSFHLLGRSASQVPIRVRPSLCHADSVIFTRTSRN